MIAVSFTVHNAGPHTIWAKLAERLGREPTNAEAAEEVRRILREARHERRRGLGDRALPRL